MTIPIDKQIALIERWLRVRRITLPRRVLAKKITHAEALEELETTEAVLATLKRAQAAYAIVAAQGLEPRTSFR